MKRIHGYVRTTPGGDPIGSIPVTVRDKNTNLAIPVGGMINASTNPVNTQPDGSFDWTSELSPGPVYVDAQISITESKVRDGSEVMQAGDVFISDLEEMFLIFDDGVISNVYSDLMATASVVNRDITVQPGRMCLVGRIWGIDSNRILTGAANTTLASRRDLIVARQYIGGTSKGRQDLVRVLGTISGVDPVLNSNPDIYEVALWRATTPQNSATSTLTDLRVFATSFINNNTVTAAKLSAGGSLSTAAIASILKAPTSGVQPAYGSLGLTELSDVDTTGVASGNLLRWNGAAWVPSNTLPAHGHTEADITNLVADLAAKANLNNPTFTTGITAPVIVANTSIYTPGSMTVDGSVVIPNNALTVAKISGLQATIDDLYGDLAAFAGNLPYLQTYYNHDFQDNASNDTVGFSGYTLAMQANFVLPAGTWDIWGEGSMIISSTAGGWDMRIRSSTINGSPSTKTVGESPANDRNRAEVGVQQTGYVSNGVTSYALIIEYQAVGSGTATGENPFIRIFAKRTA